MTKPSRPRANSSPVVEIDAMDVLEWQHGQRTPQASDANLAALVRQSAKHESAPIEVEPARKAPLVARARVTDAPPSVPRIAAPARRPSEITGKPPAFPAIATPMPPRMPAASEAPPARPSPRPSRPSGPSGPSGPADVPMSVSGYPIYRGANGSSDAHPALDARPAEAPAPPPVVLPLPAPAETPRPMQAPMMHPIATPSPWAPPPVTQLEPSPYPVVVRAERPSSADPFGLGDQQTSSPDVRGHRELAEARKPRGSRRVIWLVGASAVAAAALAVIAFTGGSSEPAAPSIAEPAVAKTAEAPVESPVVEAPVPAVEPPAPAPAKIVAPIAHPLDARPAVAAATPPSPPPPRAPIHAAPRAGHRFAKKIVVDYQGHRDEAPVPSLVAQASEDPAIARARNAYLSGNDKLFAGDATGAIAAYHEALDLYPGYVGGYRGLGLAYALLGDNKKAIDALKSYVTAAPGAKDAPLIKKRIARLLTR
jgi:hypothetical protein